MAENQKHGGRPAVDAVTLHHVDPSQNMSRFYRLDVQPDMFGFWLLVREWGRIGRSGQTRVESFTTIDEAHVALQHQQRAKEKRGYRKRLASAIVGGARAVYDNGVAR